MLQSTLMDGAVVDGCASIVGTLLLKWYDLSSSSSPRVLFVIHRCGFVTLLLVRPWKITGIMAVLCLSRAETRDFSLWPKQVLWIKLFKLVINFEVDI